MDKILRYKHYKEIACALCLLWLIAGCAREKGPIFHQMAHIERAEGCRVAVLPLEYTGRYPQGEMLFYKVFSSELAQIGDVWLISEGDIMKILQDLMIYPNEKPNFEELQFIAHRLSADYLVAGTIYELRMSGNGGPHISVYLQVYDGESGKILWDTYHNRSGTDYQKVMHFGEINTMLRLAKQVSKEIVDTWLERGMAQCRR